MSKITQHQAVMNATKTYFGNKFQTGVDIKSYATKEDRKAIAMAVAEGMIEGKVELSAEAKAKYGSDINVLVSKYVAGMVTNWFNKSKELNGNTQHTIKNPGSRSQDPQLKNLRLLLTKYEGKPEADAIRAAIANRLAELKPAKAEAQVDVDSIPTHLRNLIAG